MGYEIRSLCQGETKRLLWPMGIMLTVIVAFQYFELPYDHVLSSVFSTGKVPAPAVENNSLVTGGPESKSEIASDTANGLNSTGTHNVHEMANDTRTSKAEDANLQDDFYDGEDNHEEPMTEKLEELNKNSTVDTVQNAGNGPGPEKGRESEQSFIQRNDSGGAGLSPIPVSPVMDLSSNITLQGANISTPPITIDSNTSSMDMDATPALVKIEKPAQSSLNTLGENSSGVDVPKENKKPEIPTPAVITIAEMKNMLLQNRASYRSMRPRLSSAVDQEMLYARSQIENAPLLKNDHELYAPLYRSVSRFKRSYELMEETLKVYVYKEGQRPILHEPVLKGIYASEGWFMKQLEANKQFVTRDSRKAHLFYLPFSSRMLEETLYVQNSHNHKDLIQYLRNYVNMISAKHNFWNRTEGADHFLVACHDWAPAETRIIMANCIRALCNSDVKQGFVFGKDVSLPETNVLSPQNPLWAIGGKPASQRSILAFFAGSMHGYLRPILLHHWENKDPDMKIFGQMPKAKGRGKRKGKTDYIQHMKSSKYCICAKGYEVHSPRVVEAIFYECVPVIISDNFVPPFFEILNWESFAVFVLERDIPNLKNILLSISEKRYLKMQMMVKKVQQHFLWHPRPVKYDIFHMILHSIWYNRVFLARAR
ncbi:exostosin domain-containing protein [Citrus sinensis]|uniref:probable glycosyltransferase At5g03795 isoform X2 n=1 Tax=Citrus sinensis TaxID=2711 RepID=UPI0003D712A3|nr:probable glycosyltransferase At5g03795 isoform X2 [Citrus sinensis]KAH9761212.1 exostosin domain-containing protein [Citrus sinensis]GAY48327.1 hypothetical protein CUMW_110780 [Citrus unshiu]